MGSELGGAEGTTMYERGTQLLNKRRVLGM